MEDVRVLRTGALRTAAFRAEGTAPEPAAFALVRAWAGPRGLLDDPSSFLLLGRNDPPPSPGNPVYGYVYLLTVPPEVEVGGGGEEVEVPPSTWAVVRARLANVGERWEGLYRWAAAAGRAVTGHGLEEHLALPDRVPLEQLLLDLWLPLGEPEGADDAGGDGRRPRR